MAFNGTGTFVRIYNWVTDKGNSVPITASRMDTEMDGMATGLSSCITKDGQTTVTANIPMASHKFTGLSTGNARTDSLTLGQVQDGQFTALGTTGGAADAYTATPSPAITAYVVTMRYSAKIQATNLTTTPTLAISGLTAGTIKKFNNSGTEVAVEASDLIAGVIYDFMRNPANDAWIVLNPNRPYLTSANFVTPSGAIKNTVINGDFNIWQRNTSFATIADATYTADRWVYNKVGAAVHTISRSTDVPTVAQAGRLFNYSALIDCTTVDSSIAAGDYVIFSQRIEGYNWLPIAQTAIVLSFWVKATKTGIHCASLRNSTPDRSYVCEFTINTTDTWEQKTCTFTASPSAGTWDYINGIGAYLTICLSSGATFQTTAGAWQTGNYFATSNQVNATDSTSNDFRICGVQLEKGSTVSSFENRTINQELQLCQRYYEKSYDTDTAIGTVTGNGASHFNATAGGSLNTAQDFKVSKRAVPTIVLYSTTSGGSGVVRDTTAPADVATTAAAVGTSSYYISKGGLSATAIVDWHFTASAEL